jgi:hypothetical protein
MAGSRFGLLLASIFVAGIGISGFGSEVEWTCGYRLFPPQLKGGVYPHHYRPDVGGFRTPSVGHSDIHEGKSGWKDRTLFHPPHSRRGSSIRFEAMRWDTET